MYKFLPWDGWTLTIDLGITHLEIELDYLAVVVQLLKLIIVSMPFLV